MKLVDAVSKAINLVVILIRLSQKQCSVKGHTTKNEVRRILKGSFKYTSEASKGTAATREK
jgi:hypothetical protein